MLVLIRKCGDVTDLTANTADLIETLPRTRRQKKMAKKETDGLFALNKNADFAFLYQLQAADRLTGTHPLKL